MSAFFKYLKTRYKILTRTKVKVKEKILASEP